MRKVVKVLAALLVCLVVLAAAVALHRHLRPKTYNVSPGVFRQYLQAGVPQTVIDRLEPHYGKEYQGRAALRAGLRELVGEADFARYEDVLLKHARANNCRPTASPLPMYQIQLSRGHALYRSMALRPVLHRNDVPIVPTNLLLLPDGAGYLMLGQHGPLYHYGLDFKPRWQLELPGVFELAGDQGALGIAADPDFARNRHVYVSFVSTGGKENVVQRLTFGGDPAAVLASLVDVIRFPKDDTHHFHGIGPIAFDAQGALLIAVGDPTDHAQVPWDYQGKLLRVVPGQGPRGGYTLPAYGLAARLGMLLHLRPPIVQAMGLRAPFQGTPWQGGLIIGDVGGNGPYSFEKINLYNRAGLNFGWGACGDPTLLAGFEPPIVTYRRNDPAAYNDMAGAVSALPRPGAGGDERPEQSAMAQRLLRPVNDPTLGPIEGRTVVAGAVYPGGAHDRYGGRLDGRLLYSDFYLGFIRGATLAGDGHVTDDVLLTRQPFITAMVVGHDGYVYVVTAVGEFGLERLVLK